eukprot:scaffold12036_cov80-Isochrysis_galbana.AAC.1
MAPWAKPVGSPVAPASTGVCLWRQPVDPEPGACFCFNGWPAAPPPAQVQKEPWTERVEVDFGPGVGVRAGWLLDNPDVPTCHVALRVPSIASRFGTAPMPWNYRARRPTPPHAPAPAAACPAPARSN